MTDGSIPRPAPASLQPILSVLARSLVGGAEGGRNPLQAALLAARPAAPSVATQLAPSPAAGPSGSGISGLGLPSGVPAWAQALAGVAPDGQPLGEALGALSRLIAEQSAERALPGPEGRALAEALQALSTLDGLDGPELRDRLTSIGLGLESRLAQAATERPGRDAKPLETADLLGLKALLLRARATAPEGEVRQGIERVLSTLDGEQLHNVARAEHGEPPVEHLPLPDGEGWATAWFQHRRGGQHGRDGSAGDDHASLTVGLTLSALGPIRLDLDLAPELLRVRVAVAEPRTRALLERDLDGLVVELERVGRPVAIGIEVAPPETLGPPAPVVDGQLDVAA